MRGLTSRIFHLVLINSIPDRYRLVVLVEFAKPAFAVTLDERTTPVTAKVVLPKSGLADHFWSPKLVRPDHFWSPKMVGQTIFVRQKWSCLAKNGPLFDH